MVVRAEFDSRDDSYRWMLQWLTNHPALRESNHFTVASTLRRVGHTALTDEVDPAADTSEPVITGLLQTHHQRRGPLPHHEPAPPRSPTPAHHPQMWTRQI